MLLKQAQLGITRDCLDLLNLMLQRKQKYRPSAEQCLKVRLSKWSNLIIALMV